MGAIPAASGTGVNGEGLATPKPGAIRIAADESVRKAADPLAVARAGAADLLVIKAQPLGGVARALEIVREAGLPVVVSSALDPSVGLALGLHPAAALPEGQLAGACGLGTVALPAGDVARDPRGRRGGGRPPPRPAPAPPPPARVPGAAARRTRSRGG